jgi:hypothetical protein
MKLKFYRPGEAPQKTCIHFGMVGSVCMFIALLVGDGFKYAFILFLLESAYLTVKTNKDRMK